MFTANAGPPRWTKWAQVGSESAGAIFGERGPADPYRYVLWRDWRDMLEPVPKAVAFVMLNPSTATHEKPDPTITRCINFAKRWHFTRLVVLNCFALRSTSPKLLPQHGAPVGPLNDELTLTWLKQCERVICAWGNDGILHRRCDQVISLIRQAGHALHALEVTQEGQPWHPLYVPAHTLPTLYHPHPMPVRAREPGDEG